MEKLYAILDSNPVAFMALMLIVLSIAGGLLYHEKNKDNDNFYY